MIRGMSRAFFTFLCLFLSTHFAHAIAIPPAAIDEQQVQPACVTVGTSYLFGQKQVYGTDGKGPAVRIENGCAHIITVESVSTGIGVNSLEHRFELDAAGLNYKNLHEQPKPFILMLPPSADCKARETAQKKSRDEHAQKTAARKELMEKAVSADELLEHVRVNPLDEPDSRQIACGAFMLEPGSVLVLAMPWETHYLITGRTGGGTDTKPDLKISGQMINPLDVNSPETFQFAQNGDKATRYMLAVHNIGTGQNLKLALRWLKEAAEQAYRPAILQLSECYETGKCGVDKDAKEALFWRMLGRAGISSPMAICTSVLKTGKRRILK